MGGCSSCSSKSSKTTPGPLTCVHKPLQSSVSSFTHLHIIVKVGPPLPPPIQPVAFICENANSENIIKPHHHPNHSETPFLFTKNHQTRLQSEADSVQSSKKSVHIQGQGGIRPLKESGDYAISRLQLDPGSKVTQGLDSIALQKSKLRRYHSCSMPRERERIQTGSNVTSNHPICEGEELEASCLRKPQGKERSDEDLTQTGRSKTGENGQ